MIYPFLQRRCDGTIWTAGHTVWGLCAALNHATDPGLFMDDREHGKARTYARAIRNRMKRLGLTYGQDYRELSNGMVWPMRRFPHHVTPLTSA